MSSLRNILSQETKELKKSGVLIKTVAPSVKCNRNRKDSYFIVGNFALGRFVFPGQLGDFRIKRPTIFLSTKLRSINSQLVTLWHEKGHLDCWKRNCQCISRRQHLLQITQDPNNCVKNIRNSVISVCALAEFHANRYALRQLQALSLEKASLSLISRLLQDYAIYTTNRVGDGLWPEITINAINKLSRSAIWRWWLKNKMQWVDDKGFRRAAKSLGVHFGKQK
jgi:hypothetical protein